MSCFSKQGGTCYRRLLFNTCRQWIVKGLVGFFVALWARSAVCSEPSGETLNRVVLAFYDSQLGSSEIDGIDGLIARSAVHRAAEMPLNHLGLKVRYHDIQAPLPRGEAMVDVRGILLWLHSEFIPEPDVFLSWLIQQMQGGKPVVVMGSHAFEYASPSQLADRQLITQFWNTLGLEKADDWAVATYDVELKGLNENITAFERDFSAAIPQFPIVNVVDQTVTSYLAATPSAGGNKLADLVTVGARGAYVAPSFARIIALAPRLDRSKSEDIENPYWFINPLRFFGLAFNTDGLPRPDTTTLSGRRIYYSQIDGDGWRNRSLIPKYRNRDALASEVVLQEIFLKHPDLPVTVAPVAGDLDTEWFGTERAQQVAREIFKLPQIEAGSHTYCHPLAWGFFRDYHPEKEAPYLDEYPALPGKHSLPSKLKALLSQSLARLANTDTQRGGKHQGKKAQAVMLDYRVPRAYYNGPYELQKDIQGSVDFIEKFLPKGKRVEVFQWSGDTLALPEALQLTRRAGLGNINGGDTRFDAEFDSLNWVSPIGRSAGGERQIYASASNENTYTQLWTDRFYGFSYLRETFKRTEMPVRLKPMNIYYHMYIGERQASLASLKTNLQYAASQPIAPITTSRFAAIAEGFYSSQFEKIAERRWRVMQRGKLQTIRFDRATLDAVDFANSEGVIGQTHLQGSLYVALDPKHPAPVIALKTIEFADRAAKAERAYLLNARWWVEALQQNSAGFQFKVSGFGAGEMLWYVPNAGRYTVNVEYADGGVRQWQTAVGEDNLLALHLIKSPIEGASIRLVREREQDAGL